jgi:putative transposase
MQGIDKIFIAYPTTGAKKMTARLQRMGYKVNIKRIRRLMHKMNLVPIFPRKSLSIGGNAKYVYPYLLRGLEINHPNQVWSTIPSPVKKSTASTSRGVFHVCFHRWMLCWMEL